MAMRKRTRKEGLATEDEVAGGQPVVQPSDNISFNEQDLAMFEISEQNADENFQDAHSAESSPFGSPMALSSPESVSFENFFNLFESEVSSFLPNFTSQ